MMTKSEWLQCSRNYVVKVGYYEQFNSNAFENDHKMDNFLKLSMEKILYEYSIFNWISIFFHKTEGHVSLTFIESNK